MFVSGDETLSKTTIWDTEYTVHGLQYGPLLQVDLLLPSLANENTLIFEDLKKKHYMFSILLCNNFHPLILEHSILSLHSGLLGCWSLSVSGEGEVTPWTSCQYFEGPTQPDRQPTIHTHG